MPRFRIPVAPLSVNQCWQGQRFKTPTYKKFESDMLSMLPKIERFPVAPFILKYSFGFSNILSDLDNPVKPFTDILQKKYKFNDKDIFKLMVEKIMVKKGEEFIDFELKTLKK